MFLNTPSSSRLGIIPAGRMKQLSVIFESSDGGKKGVVIRQNDVNDENNNNKIMTYETFKAEQEERIYNATFSANEWLDRSNSKIFRQYKNSTECSENLIYNGLRALLQSWIKIAEERKIRYFLTDGSLLGAWRDGDQIPYDYDLDIRVHVDDLRKIYPLRERKKSWNPYLEKGDHIYFTPDWEMPYEIRQRYACNGKRVRMYQGECSFTDPPARLINGDKHIDIFVYQTYEQVLQFFPSRQAEYYLKDAFPLVKCSFLKETTWCPRNPKQILDQIYSMKLNPGKICKNGKWVSKDEVWILNSTERQTMFVITFIQREKNEDFPWIEFGPTVGSQTDADKKLDCSCAGDQIFQTRNL